MKKRLMTSYLWLAIILLVIDQATKLVVKMNFKLGDFVEVTDWFQIRFVENNGMAFGFEFGGEWGKILLNVIRIVAIVLIFGFLKKTITRNTIHYTSRPLRMAWTFILAGAAGNVLDSAFYGTLFTESYGQVAEFLPEVGYAPMFFGKVVDMLYFPLIDTILPDWVPFKGGERFTFFDPVFNMADVFISTGVGIMLVWNKQCFPPKTAKKYH